MSRRIGQPVNQVRLTNVAMVRMHKGGKRFEVACYRNKVLSWRQGVETDIDEVLQTHNIFLNVSKGVLASSKDLMDCFGKDDVEELLQYILEKGEYHPSDKEREAMLESTYRDIATIVAEKSVNPASNRPYTVKMILSGMKEIHFAVNPARNAKQQALEVIKRLKEVMPIERAKMHLRAVCPTVEDVEQVVEGLKKLGIDTSSSSSAGAQAKEGGGSGGNNGGGGGKRFEELDLLVDPGLFRAVDEIVRGTKGRASLQVLELNVQQEGEADVDLEIARKEVLKKQQQEQAAAAAAMAEAEKKKKKKNRGGDDEGESEEEEEGVGQHEEEEDEEGEGGRGGGGGGGNKGNKKSKAAKRREKEQKKERELRKQQEAERRQHKQQSGDAGEEDSSASKTTGSSSNNGGGGGGGGGGGKRLACNTCRVDFGDAKDYREHYRTDWHRYNLKLKEKGGGPVSEKEFAVVDADELFFQDRGV